MGNAAVCFSLRATFQQQYTVVVAQMIQRIGARIPISSINWP